eukprot:CAMPEP_0204216470 /NCGR_PEP_ID=MMETSP0361-20130328/78208_1 /ASSEMBLY_ACC=CAM_ASM_000343 /TAXON_ID=268821 /ORGANISM="Scrippsiella Hangoei, Strain SHTV-5" /LENGTH=43 /DNA_ID= /DNA_START= /DNA_END= /DNA_ORIENTATION=
MTCSNNERPSSTACTPREAGPASAKTNPAGLQPMWEMAQTTRS